MPSYYVPLKPDCYYHIYNRGVNGLTIFPESRNYPYFLERYAHHIEPVAVTYAYCLLRNHFHFLIRIRTEAEQQAWAQQNNQVEAEFNPKASSRHFNNLFIAYARAFNKAYERTGPVFEKPFHRKRIDYDRYFTALIAYIHRNPQKHGLIPDFRDWPYSSYRAILSPQPTKVQRAAVLAWFAGPEGFAAYHRQIVDEARIGTLLGDDQ